MSESTAPLPPAVSVPPLADSTPAPPHSAPTRKYDRSIVEGPLGPAVWRIAWPTMLQNVIGGLQGLIDHVMVGHYVGYAANAAIVLIRKRNHFFAQPPLAS